MKYYVLDTGNSGYLSVMASKGSRITEETKKDAAAYDTPEEAREAAQRIIGSHHDYMIEDENGECTEGKSQ